MKVQIWSDFVCPFCYIGKRHLTQAINELGEDIEIEMMSYELDPHYVDQPGLDIHQTLANKYGSSYEEAKANNDYSAKMAAEVGLVYNHDTMKYSNTFKAHKLFQKSKEIGQGNEFAERVLKAFFTDGDYINDEKTLIRLAKEVGINEEEAHHVLNSDEYSLKVRQDEQWARTINAKGAPHFVIDDKVSVSGAQPVEVFKSAINHVKQLNETQELMDQATAGMMCTDESCSVE
ncbi:DsbA family oxidoreductase [Erysipelothrix urinaevulpis]|uniref:DsbA family oxidoreductase n=1 Tax=Erysipelothrix urinaevulpis TaxID=2683717 RepID=UPI0013582731|nr:DsbA family oxidoreductase [Erysipelothrix urinaevulpis]